MSENEKAQTASQEGREITFSVVARHFGFWSPEEVAQLRAQKDQAYAERNRLVAAFAAMALWQGWRVGLGRHVGENWEDDWRNIVFIDLPSGQVSWHIHDSELQQFAFLPQYKGAWDGHSNEEKYQRLAAITRQA
jgi:hypothetical protein